MSMGGTFGRESHENHQLTNGGGIGNNGSDSSREAAEGAASDDCHGVPIVLCGDFNTTPTSSTCQVRTV
jgi:hypothetical protein